MEVFLIPKRPLVIPALLLSIFFRPRLNIGLSIGTVCDYHPVMSAGVLHRDRVCLRLLLLYFRGSVNSV